MEGKVCLITGGTSGIGKASAAALARKGATIVIAARSEARGAEAVAEVVAASGNEDVSALVCDLASQSSMRSFAAEFLSRFDRLDVFVHSGGAVFPKRILTEDGVESNFAVAYLSSFLLVHLLRERMIESAPARIVIVAGEYHRKTSMDFDNLVGESSFSMTESSSQAVLAKVLFATELARRLTGTGVCVNSLHPGAVRTHLLRNLPWYLRGLAYPVQLFFASPEKGARTPVYLASSPEVEGVSGKYFSDCEAVAPSAESQNPEVAARLWQASLGLIGL